MAPARKPGPICSPWPFAWPQIDDGTLCRQRSPLPGSVGLDHHPSGIVSAMLRASLANVVKSAVQISLPVGAPMGWDGYVRLLYEHADKALQQQANELLSRGNITTDEARFLVESQRNGLVLEFRKPLSPFGKLYSEILKPSNSLPTLEQLVAQKGSIEAVLQSVGKSRVIVNRMALTSRVAGTGLIILSITFSAIAIWEAPPDERGRVTATEVGGTAGAIGGGSLGMWGGCLVGALATSESLVGIPFGCLAGGFIGGTGMGWAGDQLGRAAGGAIYDFVTSINYE